MLQILLAEDNVGDILLVQEALREHHIGGDLHVVRDGAAAIDFLRSIDGANSSASLDLLLLDINLPKVDGPEFLTAFKKHPGCSNVPVIVVSSSDSPRDRSRMAALGIFSYFVKPCDFDSFLLLGAIVREAIEGTKK